MGRKRQRAAAWARTMAVFAAIPQGVHFGGRFVRRRTALAFVLIIGTPERLGSGKSIASYLGLVPSEESSGDRRRLGHITKQGYLLLRPAGGGTQVTVRSDPEWRGSFSIWPCGGDGRLPRSTWLVDGGSSLLDVAQGMGLRADEKVRFARGTARKSPWCAAEHQVIDRASRSSSRGVRTAIMIDVVTEEMHGSD